MVGGVRRRRAGAIALSCLSARWAYKGGGGASDSMMDSSEPGSEPESGPEAVRARRTWRRTGRRSCRAASVSVENGSYNWNLSVESPAGSGIFDFARADNPFADYTFVYVPLCTGDLYLGDTTREYSPELTVEHKGFVDGTAALGYLAEHYSDAAQVVVVGKTAGGPPLPSTAASSPTWFPTPRSPCSVPSRARSPTTQISPPRSSARGVFTTRCPAGRSTKD